MLIFCIVGTVASFLGAVTLAQIDAPTWQVLGLMFWGAVLSIVATRVE